MALLAMRHHQATAHSAPVKRHFTALRPVALARARRQPGPGAGSQQSSPQPELAGRSTAQQVGSPMHSHVLPRGPRALPLQLCQCHRIPRSVRVMACCSSCLCSPSGASACYVPHLASSLVPARNLAVTMQPRHISLCLVLCACVRRQAQESLQALSYVPCSSC